jgi:hypothetical protein
VLSFQGFVDGTTIAFLCVVQLSVRTITKKRRRHAKQRGMRIEI